MAESAVDYATRRYLAGEVSSWSENTDGSMTLFISHHVDVSDFPPHVDGVRIIVKKFRGPENHHGEIWV